MDIVIHFPQGALASLHRYETVFVVKNKEVGLAAIMANDPEGGRVCVAVMSLESEDDMSAEDAVADMCDNIENKLPTYSHPRWRMPTSEDVSSLGLKEDGGSWPAPERMTVRLFGNGVETSGEADKLVGRRIVNVARAAGVLSFTTEG